MIDPTHMDGALAIDPVSGNLIPISPAMDNPVFSPIVTPTMFDGGAMQNPTLPIDPKMLTPEPTDNGGQTVAIPEDATAAKKNNLLMIAALGLAAYFLFSKK